VFCFCQNEPNCSRQMDRIRVLYSIWPAKKRNSPPVAWWEGDEMRKAARPSVR
jgi:hypothetical protein